MVLGTPRLRQHNRAETTLQVAAVPESIHNVNTYKFLGPGQVETPVAENFGELSRNFRCAASRGFPGMDRAA